MFVLERSGLRAGRASNGWRGSDSPRRGLVHARGRPRDRRRRRCVVAAGGSGRSAPPDRRRGVGSAAPGCARARVRRVRALVSRPGALRPRERGRRCERAREAGFSVRQGRDLPRALRRGGDAPRGSGRIVREEREAGDSHRARLAGWQMDRRSRRTGRDRHRSGQRVPGRDAQVRGRSRASRAQRDGGALVQPSRDARPRGPGRRVRADRRLRGQGGVRVRPAGGDRPRRRAREARRRSQRGPGCSG